MNVTLSPKREAMVRRKVESGQFNDPSDVVEEALRLMEEQERYARLKAAITKADEYYEKGETLPLTPERIEAMTREAERRELNGEDPNPDVCPS